MLKNHLDPTIVSTGPTINTSLGLTDGRTYTTKHRVVQLKWRKGHHHQISTTSQFTNHTRTEFILSMSAILTPEW